VIVTALIQVTIHRRTLGTFTPHALAITRHSRHPPVRNRAQPQ
jgi:hypothetical protein